MVCGQQWQLGQALLPSPPQSAQVNPAYPLSYPLARPFALWWPCKCMVTTFKAGAQSGCLAHTMPLHAAGHAVGLQYICKSLPACLRICNKNGLKVPGLRAEACDIGNSSGWNPKVFACTLPTSPSSPLPRQKQQQQHFKVTTR